MYIKNGKVFTVFLKICELNDRKAASERALLDICTKLQIPTGRISAFSSDSTAVMVECRNGVAAKLKEYIPHLVAIHSVLIRLQTVYYFFQNSSVPTAHLQEIQQVLGDPSLKLKEPKHVH